MKGLYKCERYLVGNLNALSLSTLMLPSHEEKTKPDPDQHRRTRICMVGRSVHNLKPSSPAPVVVTEFRSAYC
jgi:hypothetical protein